MKRSEAIRIIYDMIHGESFSSCEYTDTEHYCDIILNNLEKAGMLPPQIINPKVYKEHFYDPSAPDVWNIIETADYYRGEVPYKLKINAWEEE